MEYKVMKNGTAVWYKLLGNSQVPVEVSVKYLDR